MTAQSILEVKGNAVTTIDRNASAGQAADLMSAGGIGALVVTDGDRAVGILTERDILGKVVARRRDPNTVAVAELMTSPMACCRRDTPLDECRSVMTQKGLRHLPVVEGGRLFGLISSRDLIATEIEAKQGTIKDLETTVEMLNEYLYSRS